MRRSAARCDGDSPTSSATTPAPPCGPPECIRRNRKSIAPQAGEHWSNCLAQNGAVDAAGARGPDIGRRDHHRPADPQNPRPLQRWQPQAPNPTGGDASGGMRDDSELPGIASPSRPLSGANRNGLHSWHARGSQAHRNKSSRAELVPGRIDWVFCPRYTPTLSLAVFDH
jgi:hypothetical protein